MEYIFKKIDSQNLGALTDFFAKNKGVDFFDPFPLNDESAMHIAKVNKVNFYFGIFDSERIIGFGMLRWHKNYQSPTLGLLVDKNHRGEGLGTKIYEYLFRIAKEKKCPEIIAITHKNNVASTHIAKKLGMKEIDQKNPRVKDHYNFSEYIKNNPEKLILIKKLIPKVSICIITYNHEKYIRDTINGALAQKTDFDYEIVIGEDCSTDNTRNIIMEYASKYPNKFKLLLPENNLGMMNNFIATLEACTGEYIALCEGDDYWIDPNKLQKQINFLEDNPEYSISSHNVNVIYEGTNPLIKKEWLGHDHKQTITIEDLMRDGSGGATCSLIFSNKVFSEFPEWYGQQKGGDWTLQVLCATKGKMKYFTEVMGVYRKHGQGAIFNLKKKAEDKGESSFSLASKYSLEMIAVVNKYLDFKYDKQLRQQSTYWYQHYITEYLKIGDIKMAKKYAIKILKEIFPWYYWKISWLTKKEFIKLLVIAILPYSLIKIIKRSYGALKNRVKKLNKFINEKKSFRRFNNLYIKYESYTMIPKKIFIGNLHLCQKYSAISGSVVECDVWKGGMIAAMADILGENRSYFLFDSFEGLPAVQNIDGESAKKWQSDKNSNWYFNNCSADIKFSQKAMSLSRVKKYKIIKGWFSETLPKFNPTDKIAILRLDGDWYESTMLCLENLYKYVSKNGLIIIDDYYTWDGCAKAVYDFMSKNKLADRIYSTKNGVSYIIKN